MVIIFRGPYSGVVVVVVVVVVDSYPDPSP
jgi:hypothetical protein